jgi:hypothetical protein
VIERKRDVTVAVLGGAALFFGASGGIYDATGHYANGCGHGSLVAVGASLGAVLPFGVAIARPRPPVWLAISMLALTLPVVGAASSISADDLSGGGCRRAQDAALEDALSAGWLTLAGGLALAGGLLRPRKTGSCPVPDDA